MIIDAEIINQPDSGEYDERIYRIDTVWASEYWSFVKFTNDDSTQWCGQFPGFPKQVAISTIKNVILVLTSDYLFQADRVTGDLTYIEDQVSYQNLTVAPNGEFILADYYHLLRVITCIQEKELIKSPIQMDMIKFKEWESSKLEFTCYEFLNCNDRYLAMTYDCRTNEIEIKNEI